MVTQGYEYSLNYIYYILFEKRGKVYIFKTYLMKTPAPLFLWGKKV